MGMFDRPVYLTGENGYVTVGETFYLHAAKLDGTIEVRGKVREQAKLLVSRTRDSKKETVLTSGAGIVGQVKRMDDEDRAGFPLHVRLDEVPSREGNPARVLTPANQPSPATATVDPVPDF